MALAKAVSPEICLEDLCFELQQCAEKAVKAVFIFRGQHFPYIHELAKLLGLLEQNGLKIPKYVWEADHLSRFAVVTRYPGQVGPVNLRTYRRSIRIATAVLGWAKRRVGVT